MKIMLLPFQLILVMPAIWIANKLRDEWQSETIETEQEWADRQW